MKRGTPRHPKMIHLAELAMIDLPWAVGLMEMLWHFTSEFAPTGDIGRFSDASICKHLAWTKQELCKDLADPVQKVCRRDADLMRKRAKLNIVQCMLDARFLERHSVHRLIVHDWKEHCEQSVTRKVEKSKQQFVESEQQLPDSKAAAPQLVKNSLPKPLPKPLPLPTPTKPPDPPSADDPDPEAQIKTLVLEIAGAHPVLSKVSFAETQAQRKFAEDFSADSRMGIVKWEALVRKNHAAQVEIWTANERREGKSFAVGLEEWFRSGMYRVSPKVAQRGKSQTREPTAEELHELNEFNLRDLSPAQRAKHDAELAAMREAEG